MSYILTHWRGHSPLWRAFWINGVALRALVLLGFGALGAAAPLAVSLVAVLLGADLLCLIWQSIGYFRSAERNLRELGSVLPLWAGMIALIIAVFASLSQWWALALQTTPFLSDEPYAEMRNRHYAAQYDLFAEGEVVQLTGVIALGATRDLQHLLQTHPDVTRIELDSDGGHIFEARGIARLVLEQKLDSHVTRRCSSACTLVFVAGQRRLLAPGARLGFHGYALGEAEKLPRFDIAAEQERDRSFLRSRGVSETFLARIYQSGPDEIWFPSVEELEAAGVVTQSP
ncbi:MULTISPECIES: hypothetical protein [unclassified Aliiroseovarius]|uniref:COG3904 family protein n=1 Tax=unclassified Aliiroseovarius TaxID=2623558 RepID=UPI0015694DE0|nr:MULTISPECIES: hypothetical protein [unclassified Aliiroseovarius]NRP13399.1 hypothetical protein [Aliiroseovarius sp. xm-d-517]NRP40126.1 hypothetical protein [Aliiroseovarius sp. xm-m-339-2]NRP61132.1 hypothetical protein [Aliiroseovarius sp. xm-a-151]